MVLANSNDAAKPLLAGVGKPAPSSSTLDGFAALKSTNKLPATPDLSINTWSHWSTIKVPVLADGMKPGWIQWKGRKRYEFDLPFFYAMIRDWMRGCTEAESKMPGLYRRDTMTKEEAIDLSFSIDAGEPA